MTAMHGRAKEADDQSLENFLDFWIGHLDASCLDQLFIIHGSDTYAAVAQHIEHGLSRRGLRGTLLHFEEEPERVREIGIRHRHDPQAVACITYLLDYGRLARDSIYRSHIKNLGVFDFWDIPRYRIIADVPLELFGQAFAQSKKELIQRANMIMQRLAGIDSIEISTPSGTELIVKFAKHPTPWYPNVGNPNDHILPAGELAARPVSVDGRVDFSGTLLGTIPFGFKYGLIAPGELVLDFHQGLLTHIGGTNTPLIRDLEKIINRLPAITRVGETSLSINTGITKLAGTGYQWEERYPGFHFALGAELSENLTSLAERECPHHVDCVLSTPTIMAANETLFTNHQFCL
jgi:hypothetical protein